MNIDRIRLIDFGRVISATNRIDEIQSNHVFLLFDHARLSPTLFPSQESNRTTTEKNVL